jgi:hypothetical protein
LALQVLEILLPVFLGVAHELHIEEVLELRVLFDGVPHRRRLRLVGIRRFVPADLPRELLTEADLLLVVLLHVRVGGLKSPGEHAPDPLRRILVAQCGPLCFKFLHARLDGSRVDPCKLLECERGEIRL